MFPCAMCVYVSLCVYVQLCALMLQATKHAINRRWLQVLDNIAVTSLLHQHFFAPHGTNIPHVGWWHADVAWSSHVPVNRSEKYQRNVSSHMHLNAGMYVLKRSRSLNYTLSCTKNNVWCQLVEIMTYSRVNDKFPHKQALTECIFESYMS